MLALRILSHSFFQARRVFNERLAAERREDAARRARGEALNHPHRSAAASATFLTKASLPRSYGEKDPRDVLHDPRRRRGIARKMDVPVLERRDCEAQER